MNENEMSGIVWGVDPDSDVKNVIDKNAMNLFMTLIRTAHKNGFCT